MIKLVNHPIKMEFTKNPVNWIKDKLDSLHCRLITKMVGKKSVLANWKFDDSLNIRDNLAMTNSPMKAGNAGILVCNCTFDGRVKEGK